jgi:hypothetical protein
MLDLSRRWGCRGGIGIDMGLEGPEPASDGLWKPDEEMSCEGEECDCCDCECDWLNLSGVEMLADKLAAMESRVRPDDIDLD